MFYDDDDSDDAREESYRRQRARIEAQYATGDPDNPYWGDDEDEDGQDDPLALTEEDMEEAQ